ncbi:Ca2+:H+ antiporter [Salsuginibacillus halophilus]|uniref:Ca(2+)/H(+) antiporter n=1 Tax=Salsuginibacillus halophilus TaxID=517424 RepID=A0A2P8H960_9BACI|nr:calcium/proton exchanger [Salsuginibacillus halophilus]PSL42758.1 Ca2+:H+ antiporter [Salsuginibacillus halophilus]
MKRIFFLLAIIGLPLGTAGDWFRVNETWMFIVYALTIVGLAAYMGRATESIAIHAGERIGGLLNATFGNAAELIISIFALYAGYTSIVLASMTGAVLGNLLLVCGFSFLVGGIKKKRQSFNEHDARHNGGMLMLGIVTAFVFPHIFASQTSAGEAMTLSVFVAVILMILYISGLIFRLVTHHSVYPGQDNGTDEEETPEWTKGRSFLILLSATVGVAYMSEKLVRTFEAVGESFGWSELFLGVIVIAIVGNAAEHASAIYLAYRSKLNASVEIAVGSSIQIAMFVVPVLVLLSLAFNNHMPLVFTMPELIAMVLAVLLSIVVTMDGDTNWFEGAMLLAAYAILATGFYFL